MVNSINQTDAAALQAYIRDYRDDLWARTFYGFETSKIVDIETGVKGQRILSRLDISSKLSRRFDGDFLPKANAVKIVPRKLETEIASLEFQFTPTLLEKDYTGYLRKTGQDPYDFPYEQFIMMKLVEKDRQEKEDAVWQAVKATTPAADDALDELFDGFLKIIADATAGGTPVLPPVATGAITASNAVDKFFDLWNQVDKSYKKTGVTFFCPMHIFDYYAKNYKALNHSSPEVKPIANAEYSGMVYEYGAGRSNIVGVPGMGSSGRVIVTPAQNLVIGVDGAEDEELNVQQDHYQMDIFGAYRLGVQIRTLEPGIIVVNNQA